METEETFTIDRAPRMDNLDVMRTLVPVASMGHPGIPSVYIEKPDHTHEPVMFLRLETVPLVTQMLQSHFAKNVAHSQLTFAVEMTQAAAMMAQLAYACEQNGTRDILTATVEKMVEMLRADHAAKDRAEQRLKEAMGLDGQHTHTDDCPVCAKAAEILDQRGEKP